MFASSKFDNYWVNVASRNNLPEACTARYVPDDSVLEYEVPAEDEVEEDPVDEVGSEADDYAEEDDGETHDETPNSLCSTPALTTGDVSPPPCADSSDDSSSSDISDSGSELDSIHWVRFKRSIPYCNRCKGNTPTPTILCPYLL